MNFKEFRQTDSLYKFRQTYRTLSLREEIKKTRVEEEIENDLAYLEPMITAAEYLDDMYICLLYTSPSPRDDPLSRMPSSA